MASLDVPYLVVKTGRAGGKRYFWQPAKALRDCGWRAQRIPDNWQAIADPHALEAAAVAKARALNQEVEAWRKGAPAIGSGAAPATKPKRGAVLPGTLAAVIADYKRAPAWTDPDDRKALADSTKRVYRGYLDILITWGGKVPVRAVTAKMVQDLYEALWKKSPSTANNVVAMLRVVLEFARREGLVQVNVAQKPDMTGLAPSGRLWPRSAVALFVAVADLTGRHSIGTFILINEWLGQREGDVLAFTRSKLLHNGSLVLRQSKTGAGVMLPLDMVERLTRRLQEEIARQDKRWGVPLDAAKRPLLVNEATGEAWNAHTFRHEFAEIRAICAKLCASFPVDYLVAGSDGEAEPVLRTEELQLKHFRHTAVTRLAEAECSDQLISAITGHSLQSIKRILEIYLVRTGEMARQAFAKRLAKEQGDG